ncbi:MAG: ABC transporter permease [Planctomycetota bacterium]
MYKTFICLRYLARKRITWFSVVSVTLGVMALIVVMSVMHGFTGLLKASMHGTLSDIVVQSPSARGFAGYERLSKEIAALPHVSAVAPRIEKWAICAVRMGEELNYTPVRLIGIVPELEDSVNHFRSTVGKPLDRQRNIRQGAEWEELGALWKKEDWRGKNWKLTWDDPAMAEGREETLCIPGSQVIRRELPPSYWIGRERLKLITVEMQGGGDSSAYFTVANTFSSGMWEYDRTVVYIPLEAAQRLVRIPGAVTELMVRVDDERAIGETAQRINDLLARADASDAESRPVALGWQEVNPALLNAVNLETTTMYILLFLLLVVAGFATIAILTLIVLQKRRDIGVLMAIGAPPGGVRRVFLTFGLIIGLVGATLGVAAGMGFLWRLEDVRAAVNHITGFDPFPAELYYFSAIPKEYSALRYFKIWLAAVGVCVIASVYPAARAARLNPVEIIRYE